VIDFLAYKGLYLDELKFATYPDSKLSGVLTTGIHEETNRRYFVRIDSRPQRMPFINISTEPRETFLKSGSEQEAEEALKKLAFATRAYTGGSFKIHPFYGAVYQTQSPTVSPNFGKWTQRSDESLSMLIYLSNGGIFENELTRENLDIGLVFFLHSEKSVRWDEYMKKSNGVNVNPNQVDRDIAVANNLGVQWDLEFEKYNPHVRRGVRDVIKEPKESGIPDPMEITRANLASFMEFLQGSLGMTDFSIEQVSFDNVTEDELNAISIPREKIKFLDRKQIV